MLFLRHGQRIITGQKGIDGHAEKLSKSLQRIDIWISPARLPLGNRRSGNK